MTALAADLLRCVAGHGLPGALAAWPQDPLPDADWAQLLHGARTQRLSGLLVAAITDGALPVGEQQLEQVTQSHFAALCDSLYLESSSLQVLTTLRDAGVDPRLLKGPAVAHLDYADPALRLFADVDVLVRSDQFDRAVRAMTAAGGVRRFPEPRPGFDRRFSKGTSFVMPDGFELDLHRTFVMGPYGLRMQLDDMWERRESFELGGVRVDALDADTRLLHACFHSALGEKVPRLVPQRDVAQMLLSGRVDLDRVRALTRRWSAEAVVAKAVSQTWSTLRLADVTAMSSWAQRYAPTPREHQDLAVYSDAAGSYAAKSLAAVGAVPGLRNKAAFTLALALPERGYVQGRHSGAPERWRRGLAAARRLRDQR